MPGRVKTSQRQAGPLNNRGQAMVEYVLILIITVSLILALVTQIFKPLQGFLQSYMGDYVACLLETGELPSLGSDEANPATEECNAKFDKATWAGGRPSTGSGSGAGTTNPNTNPTNPSSSSSDSGGSSSGSRGGTYAGSSSRAGGSTFRAPGRAPTGIDGASSSSKEKTVEIALEGGGSGGFFAGSNGGTYAGRAARKTRSIGLAGLSEADKKKLERKEISGRQTLVATDGFSPPQKKSTVKPPSEKPMVLEDDKPMTIGNFIRYLFIAGIIIALVIFIGGQALQMSKSFEK